MVHSCYPSAWEFEASLATKKKVVNSKIPKET
jgi:hypothetical protein